MKARHEGERINPDDLCTQPLCCASAHDTDLKCPSGKVDPKTHFQEDNGTEITHFLLEFEFLSKEVTF